MAVGKAGFALVWSFQHLINDVALRNDSSRVSVAADVNFKSVQKKLLMCMHMCVCVPVCVCLCPDALLLARFDGG